MNRFLLILTLLNLNFSFSQESKMTFERLKAIKMTFITEKIGLTNNEEIFFWRVYNDFEKKNISEILAKNKIPKKKIF